MAPPRVRSGQRRRHRRGSTERPVNGRLYRNAFLLVSLPLLLAALTVARPAPLQRPLLPPAFDEQTALQLVEDLATEHPRRVPGSSGAISAAQWFRDQLHPYGLATRTDTWHETIAGLGRVRLQNLTALVPGQSADTVVVMAHRDDLGGGPGANDNGTGTAALIELARAYARPASTAGAPVRAAHTLVFLSTDGGAFGGHGALRFLQKSPLRRHVVAVVNLDALAGSGPPRIEIAGDRPRSPAPVLVQTASRWLLDQTGTQPHHAGFLAQLIDLAFPFTLYEQGPFVARNVPAITVTTRGDHARDAFSDTVSALHPGRLAEVGRATQLLLASLDQGLELARGTTSYVWLGDRIVRGWTLQLVLIALLVPFLVAVVDLYARCRRRRIRLRGGARALASRAGVWAFSGVVFYALGLLGAWPSGAARPPNPATAVAVTWPVLPLLVLAGAAAAAWLLARVRLAPRRRITAEEQLAGQTVALIALGVLSLLIVATNPFGLLFALPALHVWLWLPQLAPARPALRVAAFAAGLVGPALVLLSLGIRFGLGLDAPWYLLELVALRYVSLTPVLIALAGGAAASQLAAAAAGRYAPYPDARERTPRGPIRNAVRAVVLASRQRRPDAERRRAIGA